MGRTAVADCTRVVSRAARLGYEEGMRRAPKRFRRLFRRFFRRFRVTAATAALALAGGHVPGGARAGGLDYRWQPADYHDGHARPRALAFDGAEGLLYVALSTVDAVAVVDPAADPPRLVRKLPVCRFPDALAALPGGGVVVACRFDPALRRVWRDGGTWRVAPVDAGAES